MILFPPPSDSVSSCRDVVLSSPYQGLTRDNFSTHTFTWGIAPCDVKNKDSVAEEAMYVTDMFQRLFNAEVSIAW